MHDRFAINDIESLNLKSRVRERGIERERERLLIYWAFFRMQRLMRAYFLQRFSNGEATDLAKREKKSILILVVKW